MAYTYGTVTYAKNPSGNIIVDGNNKKIFEVRLGYQVNSQDIENNKSNISLQLEVRSVSSSYTTWGYSQTTTIDGTALSSKTFDFRSTNTWQIFGTRTFDVSHNADGTYSVSKSASFTTTVSSGNRPKTGSASVTVALPTIPRASSITVNDANIGSSTNITINKASSSFTTTLEYSTNNSSWTTIVTKTSNQVYGWTVPTSFYSLIPSSKTMTCYFRATTYSGNTNVGVKTTTATFTATGNPTIPTRTGTDVNSTTAQLTSNSSTSSSKMVKYASNIRVNVTATAQNSAYISKVTVNGSNVSLDGSSTSTTRSGTITFNKAETNVFTIVATDSRGYSTTQNISNTLTMLNYVPLTINQNIKRNTPTDGKINISLSGNCWNDNFRSGVSNTLTVQYRFKEYGASSWQQDWTAGNTTPSRSGNTYTYSKTLTDMDYTKSYSFEVRATDSIGTQTIVGITVSQGQPVFWWNESGLNVTNRIRFYDSTLQDYRSVNGYDISYLLRTSFSISSNSSKTLSFDTGNLVFILTGKGSLGAACYCGLIFNYGQGTTQRMKRQTLYDASDGAHLTFTISGQTLTITNNSTSSYNFTINYLMGSENNIVRIN